MAINFILIRKFISNHMLKCLIHCVLAIFTIVKLKFEAILRLLRGRQAQIVYEQQTLRWKEICFHNKMHCPNDRWGQAMTSIGNDILLFGGYTGSDFLKDLWFFDNQHLIWNKMKPKGINQIEPEARSCSSLHFHEQSNKVILFGGGTQHSYYNDVYFMSWKGQKQWEKIHIQQSAQVPPARTYQTSNLIDKYLIVFGGFRGFDLNDLWAFDMELHLWIQLKAKDGFSPKSRRFHSASILKEKLFIFGGLQKEKSISCIQFVDLSLFLKNKSQQVQWMQMPRAYSTLQRWGHSSLVVNQTIMIFGGRINANSAEVISFRQKSKSLKDIKIQNDVPKNSKMRRRSFTVIGNCVVAFGGFDKGTYNNSFKYLSLDNLSLDEPESQQMFLNCLVTPKLQSDIQSQILLNNLNIYLQQLYFNHNRQKGELLSISYQYYKQLQEHIQLYISQLTKITINNRQYSIKVNRACIVSDYFKNHFRYDKQILPIQIQKITVSAVEVCINYINTECPILGDEFSIDILLQIAELSAYLALQGLTDKIQCLLCKFVDINNCDKLLTFSYNLNFNLLFRKCLSFMFKVYIKHQNILKVFRMPPYQMSKAEKIRRNMEIQLRQIKMSVLNQ